MSRQQKRDARERELLDAARGVIADEGILEFRMAELARRAGCSVGTLYTHFESKEDVILAVAVESVTCLETLAERVAALPLRTPARLLGIVAADFLRRQARPEMAELEQLVLNASIWRRASRSRVAELRSRIEGVSNGVRNLMRDAEAAGEFATAPAPGWVDLIDYGLWGLVAGLNDLGGVREHVARSLDHSLQPGSPLVRNSVVLINSVPWRDPLQDPDVLEVLQSVVALVECRS